MRTNSLVTFSIEEREDVITSAKDFIDTIFVIRDCISRDGRENKLWCRQRSFDLDVGSTDEEGMSRKYRREVFVTGEEMGGG
jgi:hypothetical protein